MQIRGKMAGTLCPPALSPQSQTAVNQNNWEGLSTVHRRGKEPLHLLCTGEVRQPHHLMCRPGALWDVGIGQGSRPIPKNTQSE